VPDRARRKTGVGQVELTEAGVRWVHEAAEGDGLAALAADLEPALREAVLAPVPSRRAAALAARIRVRPVQTQQTRRSVRFGRLRLVAR
jgi:hypothetical protein